MGGCYDRLCCPASPKLLLGLDLGLGCDNFQIIHTSVSLSHLLDESVSTCAAHTLPIVEVGVSHAGPVVDTKCGGACLVAFPNDPRIRMNSFSQRA